MRERESSCLVEKPLRLANWMDGYGLALLCFLSLDLLFGIHWVIHSALCYGC